MNEAISLFAKSDVYSWSAHKCVFVNVCILPICTIHAVPVTVLTTIFHEIHVENHRSANRLQVPYFHINSQRSEKSDVYALAADLRTNMRECVCILPIYTIHAATVLTTFITKSTSKITALRIAGKNLTAWKIVTTNQQLLSHASLAYFFRDITTVTRNILVFDTHRSKSQYVVASCHKSLVRERFQKLMYIVLRSLKQNIDRKMSANVCVLDKSTSALDKLAAPLTASLLF